MNYIPKTKATSENVDDFLTTVEDKRRGEARQLIAIMRRVTGETPEMWGSSMIGFGVYHYISKSRCEADWFKVGFSPRKAKISLYVSCDLKEFGEMLQRLGKHSAGKGCIYLNKLEDADLDVLEEIIGRAYERANDYDATSV